MLNNRRAYATIPAKDAARARAWYQEKLGLTPAWEHEMIGMVYRLGDGTSFLLYPTAYAGTAKNTLMSFTSTDVEGDVAALKQRGVVFMDLDDGGLKTVNSVATFGDYKGAWFTDSEGNILAIGNEPG